MINVWKNLPKTVIRFRTSSVWKEGCADASQPYKPDVNNVTSLKITDIPVTNFPVPSRVIFWNIEKCILLELQGWKVLYCIQKYKQLHQNDNTKLHLNQGINLYSPSSSCIRHGDSMEHYKLLHPLFINKTKTNIRR